MRLRPFAALLVVLAVVTTGCSSLEGTGDKGYISQDGSVTTIPADQRGKAIDITGKDLDGKELSLTDLRGGVVVINVWGSWCGPCSAEEPDLVKAAAETAGVAHFVGIDIREASVDNAKAFVRKFAVPYPSIYDPDSVALLALSDVVPVKSPPTTFVLDKQGRIAATIFGALPSARTLVDLVNDTSGETSG